MNRAIAVITGILVLGFVIAYYRHEEPAAFDQPAAFEEAKEPGKIVNPMQWAFAQHLRTPPKPGELEAYQEEARQELENLNSAADHVERILADSTDAAVLKLGRDFQEQLSRWRNEYQRVIDGDFSDKAAADRYGARAWQHYWEKLTEKRTQMTMKNYLRLADGMTVWKVDSILGCSGVEHFSGGNLKTYVWQEGLAQVVASFENGKLVSKTQIGLK